MNVLNALPWRKPQPPVQRSRPVPADPPESGCGWFDSSHDLARGLQVCEHADALSVPGASMPLADWLALQLATTPRR